MKTTMVTLLACALFLTGCANPRIQHTTANPAYQPSGKARVISVGSITFGNKVRDVRVTKIDDTPVFGDVVSVSTGSHIFTICDVTPESALANNSSGRIRPMTINGYIFNGQVWKVSDLGPDLQIMAIMSDWRNP